ncbi:F10K1.23 [Zea mays]|uniref:F10K1.23 n=1 Tax=Zea mays TaxID=4577 RepID=B7ZYA5_MAIZE|nr:unknown [Zea mays]AQK81607.1 F10K1.23 [Zea mays]AQK81610.1 F10K1.23 [Zea mays]
MASTPLPPRHLDSANSIEEKDKIIEITGLQNLAKSLSTQHCDTRSDRSSARGSRLHWHEFIATNQPLREYCDASRGCRAINREKAIYLSQTWLLGRRYPWRSGRRPRGLRR